MGNKDNLNIIQDSNEKEQELESISLYQALDIIYERATLVNIDKTAFFHSCKNRLKRILKKVFGEKAPEYLKKSGGRREYSIPIKGVNCIAVLLNIDLKKELDAKYGGELSCDVSNEIVKIGQSEREKYRLDIENLYRADFEDTNIAARLYLRSQLKMLFSGCSDEVQREMAKAYNIKYIPMAEEASEKLEVLKSQVDKLLESWDADQGTFNIINETCNMSYRYIVAEMQLLLNKCMFNPDLQDAMAKLQP